MSEEKAQSIIVLCLLITLASTAGSKLEGNKKAQNINSSRVIVGGFFAMLTCSIIAEASPKAGAYLAILVSGGAFFTYGLPTLESYYSPKKVTKKNESK